MLTAVKVAAPWGSYRRPAMTAAANPMNLHVVSLPGAQGAATRIAERLAAPCSQLVSWNFAGREAHRLATDIAGRDVAVVAQLRDADAALTNLLFSAGALRQLGAARIGLVAPYLPSLRSDGARWVSKAFDWLVTVDPPLQGARSLDDVLPMASALVPSAPALAAWVQTRVLQPYLLGPDPQRSRWLSQVAALAGCPHAALRIRDDELAAEPLLPDLHVLRGHTPVLIDAAIADAQAMVHAVRRLLALGFAAPVCVGVHAVFAGDAEARLRSAGAARIVTCNTLPHPSNAIDVTGAVAEAIRVELEALHAGEAVA
jgi:ribose-phosphate pyrophosphokinase